MSRIRVIATRKREVTNEEEEKTRPGRSIRDTDLTLLLVKGKNREGTIIDPYTPKYGSVRKDIIEKKVKEAFAPPAPMPKNLEEGRDRDEPFYRYDTRMTITEKLSKTLTPMKAEAYGRIITNETMYGASYSDKKLKLTEVESELTLDH